MSRDKHQRAAFDFLRARLLSRDEFTVDEFRMATGWTKGSFDTYWNKQFKGLLEETSGGGFRVTDAFWPLMKWERFRNLVSQTRRIAADYERSAVNVLTFDFYLPLTNEESLRRALDSIFFRDDLVAKLHVADRTRLLAVFPKPPAVDDDEYIVKVAEFVSEKFVGYSISHVSGRFRASTLLTRSQAADFEIDGERYLVDETTAVTRFMFPYESDDELAKLRSLFEIVFTETITRLVNGEDQIWVLESFKGSSQLQIWKRSSE